MNRDTICVQGGYTPGNGEPRQIPIIQSTTFKYATSEDMGKLFDLETNHTTYSFAGFVHIAQFPAGSIQPPAGN